MALTVTLPVLKINQVDSILNIPFTTDKIALVASAEDGAKSILSLQSPNKTDLTRYLLDMSVGGVFSVIDLTGAADDFISTDVLKINQTTFDIANLPEYILNKEYIVEARHIKIGLGVLAGTRIFYALQPKKKNIIFETSNILP